MTQNTNNVFASKLGALLAAAGSAVGLGNIWRFPTETGSNGGAAFILVYVIFMLLLGVPMMVSEFAIGRHGGSNVADAYNKMGGRRGWKYMAAIPFIGGFLVLSYYAVVAGWTFFYAITAGMNGFAGKESQEFTTAFVDFSTNPYASTFWVFIVLTMTCVIVALGVQRGIERGAKIMMPLLFVSIIVLAGLSLTLPGAGEGLRFLFQPDFGKLFDNFGSILLNAMGQAFFSLSVGLGTLCTYACYFRKEDNLMQDGINVACIDTLVALMAGIIIFPAVYSLPGLEPGAGPSLVFITLPNVFNQVFAGSPFLAYAFSLLFYLLLVMAALTSSISMLEMSTSVFNRKFKINRRLSAVIGTVVCLGLGTLCALSFGELSDVKVFGLTFFELFDFLVAKLLMPVGGMLCCIFCGWVVKEEVLRKELTNDGTISVPVYPIYRFIIRWIAPICVLLIFANELGLFRIFS